MSWGNLQILARPGSPLFPGRAREREKLKFRIFGPPLAAPSHFFAAVY
jgi:hypothetical protein